jgi:hypothetical protein
MGETQSSGDLRIICMINPNGDDFVKNDPRDSSAPAREEAVRLETNDPWGPPPREPAGTVRERTEFFLRENPVPTILGALVLGLAIGLAIRYASSSVEREVEVKSPWGKLNLGTFSLPFLWPFFRTVKRKYEDSTEAVKDGVERLKEIEVDRYVKPLRKRWKAWTD